MGGCAPQTKILPTTLYAVRPHLVPQYLPINRYLQYRVVKNTQAYTVDCERGRSDPFAP